MSYTPTEWEPTDVVTATRMNALETAVGDMNMSYTPNTWSDGDILSAEKMNALEQAVASGGGGSSDFSTAEVTVTGEMSLPPKLLYPNVAIVSDDYASAGLSEWCIGGTFNVILYKGKAWLYAEDGTLTIPSGETNITYDSNEEAYLITGDCTITIA